MRYNRWITLALAVAVIAATVFIPGFAKPALADASEAGINAFFFDQKGLMGGLGLQGTKITKTN